MHPRQRLESVFAAALRAVHGEAVVRRAVKRDARGFELAGRCFGAEKNFDVIAIGKAATAMARGFRASVGSALRRGLVVTKEGHGAPVEGFEIREAGHPLPDARSDRAAAELLAFARETPSDHVLVVLLSGGASALTSGPLPGLSLSDGIATTDLLLRAGADIGELNTVRKRLFSVGGGRLARASGAAQIVLLAISDVPGDDLAVIGSGPCTFDPTTHDDALRVLDRHRLRDAVPASVRSHLERGAVEEAEEQRSLGSFPDVAAAIVASSRDALAAACAEVERQGLRAVSLGPVLSGEAATCARRLLHAADEQTGPVVLVASGETTVSVRGDGVGGRNQELALVAAVLGAGRSGWSMLAAGTDGTDGPTEAAGAYADGGTVLRGRSRGLEADDALARNDSYGFFASEGGLLVTGPTHTNVMDLALVGVDLEKA